MDGMPIGFMIALAIPMLFLISGVRRVNEDERMVVHRLGRFMGLKEPGIRMVVPTVDETVKLALGARGEALDGERARFGTTEAPIRSTDALRPGSIVRVVGFGADHAEVVLDDDQTRSFVCAKCGHHTLL